MVSTWKPVAVFVIIVAASSISLMLLPREIRPRIRLGEKMVYGIYVEEARKGSWEIGIEENMTTWEDVPCYKANYMMGLGRVQQGGWLKFDENGRLRHVRVWQYLDDIPRWAVEIVYFYRDEVMFVHLDNYEDLDENGRPKVTEDIMPMRKETTVAEHLWYLLRVESLGPDYAREFDLNAFPNATQLVAAKVNVIKEEKTETFAGTFDCWLISGQGPFDWMWVEKGGRLVAKLQEESGGQTRVFVLESYS